MIVLKASNSTTINPKLKWCFCKDPRSRDTSVYIDIPAELDQQAAYQLTSRCQCKQQQRLESKVKQNTSTCKHTHGRETYGISSSCIISLCHDISWHLLNLRLCTCSWANPTTTEDSLFRKSPSFQGHYPVWCPGCPHPLSPPRLTQRCGDGLCASYACVGIAHTSLVTQQTRAAGQLDVRQIVCVCVHEGKKKRKDAAVWMSDSSLLITGFEELTVSFSKA